MNGTRNTQRPIANGRGAVHHKATTPNGSTPILSTRNGKGRKGNEYILITGGAGFIGTNLAHRLLSEGHKVMIYDNLSRAGVENNLEWLVKTHGKQVEPVIADTRDRAELQRCVQHASRVFHFAAQVAVTTSLVEPINDFEVNALGTLNLLEALRGLGRPCPLVFTSTNKVYGSLDDVAVREDGGRYEPVLDQVRLQGISEAQPLDFHSPYGCSKGTADQYIKDYARSGIPHELYLRPAPIRHRRPGLGSSLSDQDAARRADHALWRWEAGAGHSFC